MEINWTKTSYTRQKFERTRGSAESNKISKLWNRKIIIFPEIEEEEFQAFGGAITEASAYTYSQMPKEIQKKVIESYFSELEMNYRVVRVPIDSCDFSLEHYEAFTNPEDVQMKQLDFSRPFKYIKTMLEDAQKAANNQLKLLLSPWSPPAFMKTNGERNHGGKLKKEYYALYAEYLCRYIQEFKNMGHFVERITIQNEPGADQSWDSCLFTASEEKEFIHHYFAPTLKKKGLDDVEIFFLDHNKNDIISHTLETLDEETVNEISGLAFHWYSGDHFEQLQFFKKKFPEKQMILSEFCVAPENPAQSAESYAHEIIGDLNAGTQAIYDWNILLDKKGGPNHVENYCEAPFMYDIEENELIKNPSADYLWHFSHFIKPGAIKLASSTFERTLEIVAFKIPHHMIIAVIFNRSENDFNFELQIEEEIFELEISGKMILTAEIPII